VEALLSAHGIAQTIEALTNSQALYLGTFATIERLRNSILAEAQGGFAGGNAGLSSEQKAEDRGELTRLRGERGVQKMPCRSRCLFLRARQTLSHAITYACVKVSLAMSGKGDFHTQKVL
jgi:hypothetical protein